VTDAALPPTATSRSVTTIDLWKTAALLLILIDHLGFFIWMDQPWMMAVGRAALPIFFFLIGFARTRAVPWSWWAAGLVLTALDGWRLMGDGWPTLNIMFNFALIRLTLPLIERHVLGVWWRVAMFAALLAALMNVTGQWLEYGTEGWLLALVGLAHRRAREAGPDTPRNPAWLTRRALGAFATLAFIAMQIMDYEFAVLETWIMAACVIAVSGLLLMFRNQTVSFSPPSPIAAALRFFGRRSLEIYMAQVAGLMALGMALGIDAADNNDGDEE
jgi:peptidoglycan/LPS O-acetylase OafA/YrhL